MTNVVLLKEPILKRLREIHEERRAFAVRFWELRDEMSEIRSGDYELECELKRLKNKLQDMGN